MKLSQLISKYHSVNFSIREREMDDDPLGLEADELYARIERTKPVDTDDVQALALLARHLIQVEDDPQGAAHLMTNIANWAQMAGVAEDDYVRLTEMALNTQH